jgi:AmiR/NasT family two-component response regulator
MRVVIADNDLRSGRRLAAEIERVSPAADVLLYDDGDAAAAGVREHHPDVVFVAPAVGNFSGPVLAARLTADAHDGCPSIVGLVDEPDPAWAERYTEAGASVVVARPVDDRSLRTALRERVIDLSS